MNKHKLLEGTSVRRAIGCDALGIEEVFQLAYCGDSFCGFPSTASLQDAHMSTLVVCKHPDILGVMTYGVHGAVVIEHLAVHPCVWRRGVASKMLSALKMLQPKRDILLWVPMENKEGNAFASAVARKKRVGLVSNIYWLQKKTDHTNYIF